MRVWAGLVILPALISSCELASDGRPPETLAPNTLEPSSGPIAPTNAAAELRGYRLAFMHRWNLFTARGDGSARRLVARVPEAYGGPSWSAAAHSFVVRTEHHTKGEIEGLLVRVSADGSEVRNLSRRSASTTDAMAAFEPEGSRITFISTRAGDEVPQLYVMNANGRGVRRVRRTPFEAQYPAWSPDGRRIAFTGVTDGFNFDLYVVHADGSGLRQLTDSPAPENWPTWSPDGQRLAYSVEDEIWTIDIASGDAQPLTPGDASAGEPNWSPDGAWIAFDCSSEEPLICAIRPDGTGFVQLFDRASFPVWVATP